MAVYRIDDSKLTAIADAIRTKTGSTGRMQVRDMPAAIAAIAGGTLPAGITVGSFSCPTTYTALGNFTIEHGLGEVPKAVLVWRKEAPQNGPICGMVCLGHEATCTLYKGEAYTVDTVTASLTNTTFLVPSPSDAGKSVWIGTYLWAAFS